MKTFETIVSEILNIKEEEIRDDASPKDIEGWDSMNYLLLISALEKEFKISFSMDEVMGATCLGDLRIVVEAKVRR